jgi:O-glycosyl hydrolase
MKRNLLFSAVLLASLSLHAQQEIVIDPYTRYQTIYDFGASDCWTADFVGRYFDDASKAKAAQWLFSKEMDATGNPLGIGLSNWRVNIGAGSATQGASSNISDETRRTECFINKDGSYDWTRSAGQQYFMKKAKEYGVDHFLLFSNSAPIYFTDNGFANANNQSMACNLSNDGFRKFADFLATTARHFADEGYNVTYIDPVNEPQYEWKDGQEGSPWRNSDIATLARELDKQITQHNLSAKILLPEAGKWEYLMQGSGAAENQIEAFWNPANTGTYIGNLTTVAPVAAGHSYWNFQTNYGLTTTRQQVAQAAARRNLQVYQTEWSMLDREPQQETGFPASYDEATPMDIALFMGKLIYADLVNANCSSWAYWTAMDQEKWGQKNRFHLLRLNNKGETDRNESYGSLTLGGTVTDTPALWVLGNYSRFVRPGYQRIALTNSELDLNGLMGTAFISPDSKTIVAVFVNTNGYASRVKLNLGNITAQRADLYVTAEGKNMAHTAVTPGATLVLPGSSVSTCVLTVDASTGISIVDHSTSVQHSKIYNLQGVCVGEGDPATLHLSTGVYIQNGKKIIIK